MKAPEGKWGEMETPNQSTLAPQFLLFAPTSPNNTPFPPTFPHFPISPHLPPFAPISPHFPPFFLVLGTLRVRCWVYYHPPRPGISEAWEEGVLPGPPPPPLHPFLSYSPGAGRVYGRGHPSQPPDALEARPLRLHRQPPFWPFMPCLTPWALAQAMAHSAHALACAGRAVRCRGPTHAFQRQ